MARIGSRTSGDVGAETSGVGGTAYINPVSLGGTGGGPDSSSGESGGTPDRDDGGISGTDSGPEPRRRGRPPGSKNKQGSQTTVKAQRVDLDAMQFSLSGIHAMLATMLQAPEWRLSEEEAAHVVKSYAAVARHFDLTVHTKTIDIGNLAVVLMIVYGSRIGATMARRRERAKERRAHMQGGVPVQTPGPAQAPPTPSKRATAPSGVGPITRPKTEADNRMLDEAIVPMFN